MAKVGYIRVSSAGQNTERQLSDIQLDKVYQEKISGKDTKRPQLHAMLDYVREGDEVYVHELSRLGRSVMDLNELVQKITKKGATITFVKENMTFPQKPGVEGMEKAIQKAMFDMLAVFSDFERTLIKERQAEGIARAKAKGKKLGRPVTITKQQKTDIKAKSKTGLNPSQLSREFGVSRATIYRIIGEKQR